MNRYVGPVFGFISYWGAQLIKFLPPSKELVPAIITSMACALGGYIIVEIAKWIKNLIRKWIRKLRSDEEIN